MFGMFTMLYSVLGFIVLFAGVLLYQHLDCIFGQSLTVAELEKARVIVLLMVFNLAVTFPLSIYGAIISAYENFIFLRVVQIARILLNTAVMIILLSYGYKAIAMVVVQTAFNIITLLLNVVYCRRKINIKVKFGKVDKRLLKEVSIYSFWIFLNTIMDRIYWSTGQFVLGAMVGTVAVAVFAVAIQLQGMYMMFSTAIVGVFLPRVTAMVTKNNDNKELSDLFIRTGRVQYIVMAFILSGFIVFGKYFIHFWAGDGYDDAYTIALLFLVPLTIPLIQEGE
jgi:O-antigen/teichoic acid export membrane protein